ncbi:CapA family protein [Limnohabitans sp. DM1]|uniref:CapA family protein n=1 Tax=Limnohabitans sp. DM1 TaxID=1597955 RepID=UPI000A4F69A0|nr:CapA family protein [Limnohabitans sp. DM1]
MQTHTTLCLAGDVMTGRGIDQIMAHPCSPELYESWVRDAREYVKLAEKIHGRIPHPVPPEHIWGEALAAMVRRQVDLRLVNLETTITTHGHPWPAKGIHYRMNPMHVNALQTANIDVCSLANNHVMDWGVDGLRETLNVLHSAGLRTVGAGIDQASAEIPAEWHAPTGERWLIFAWATTDSGVPQPWRATPQQAGIQLLDTLSEHSALQLAHSVARYRQAGDRVIVSLHWGSNWGWDVRAEQQQFARWLIDWDVADLVHGHSSHHPRPIEIYQGKLILYGCGDLINDYEGIDMHEPGNLGMAALFFANISNRTGELLRLEMCPWQLKKFRLVRADDNYEEAFRTLFNDKSSAFKTRMQVQTPGVWTLSWPPGLADDMSCP